MTCNEQLVAWVRGRSLHNEDRDECCPDFSCCRPELLAPLGERERFLAADDDGRHGMLIVFLGRALARLPGEETVYVAGCPEGLKIDD